MKDKKVGKPKDILVVVLVIAAVVLSTTIFVANRMDKPYHIKRIVSGDAIEVDGGTTIKLLGINTENSGQDVATMAATYLGVLLDGRNIWLERGLFGKKSAWVWVGCESTPKILISSLRGTGDNPIGCKEGVLVNEQIIKMGWSKVDLGDKKGWVRYGQRLYAVQK